MENLPPERSFRKCVGNVWEVVSLTGKLKEGNHEPLSSTDSSITKEGYLRGFIQVIKGNLPYREKKKLKSSTQARRT